MGKNFAVRGEKQGGDVKFCTNNLRCCMSGMGKKTFDKRRVADVYIVQGCEHRNTEENKCYNTNNSGKNKIISQYLN